MSSSIDSSFRPTRRFTAGRHRLAAGIALSLAVAAGAGATWLLSARSACPWEDAFSGLNNSGETCRTEADAAAQAAVRLGRSHGQLDNFVRQRFDQFLAEARQMQDQIAHEVETRADQPSDSAAMRLATRWAELRGERSRLLERLTPEHPSVIDVDRQIADLDRERAALSPVQTSLGGRVPEASKAAAVPPPGWKDLFEHCVVEYDQLAAECRRTERHFEEAQVDHTAALDSHLAALEHWSESAASWRRLMATPAAFGSALWATAAALLAVVGWLLGQRSPAGVPPRPIESSRAPNRSNAGFLFLSWQLQRPVPIHRLRRGAVAQPGG